MIVTMFCIYDMKLATYMSPFPMAHEGQALRAFQNLLDDKSTTMGKYPADFALYQLGKFDDSTGKMQNDYKFVVNGVDMKNGDIKKGVKNAEG